MPLRPGSAGSFMAIQCLDPVGEAHDKARFAASRPAEAGGTCGRGRIGDGGTLAGLGKEEVEKREVQR